MTLHTHELDSMERGIAGVAEAASPSDVLRAVLEASRHAAPRCAIFLARQGGLKGWGSRGYPQEPGRRLRGLSVDPASVWLGRVADLDGVCERGADEPVPDFGQPLAIEAAAVPLRVAGRTMAILMVERSEEDPPLRPALLRVLVHVARLKLELDLALRRLRPEAPGVRTAPPTAPRPVAAPPPAPAPATPEPEAAGLEPVAERREGPPEDARAQEARTFARLVATDIRLYNEQAVMLGRQHRDLADRLGDHLERGRDSFRRRFPDMGPEGLTLLREAYVQVLAGGDTSLLPPDSRR